MFRGKTNRSFRFGTLDIGAIGIEALNYKDACEGTKKVNRRNKKMSVMDSMKQSIIVPVVVIEDAKDAVPTAKALLAGGINVMEITLRTAAAMDSIRSVAKECPDMVVGVGTVLNVDQAKESVEAGAKFIVSPGFDEETVKWCIENDINVTPGCVTPTEIMAARKLGLRVVKFFPANVYGGLKAITNLAAPFTDMQFIPTGGVSTENIAEFVATKAIFAVGGSWVCKKSDISEGNFDKITQLCQEARKQAGAQ